MAEITCEITHEKNYVVNVYYFFSRQISSILRFTFFFTLLGSYAANEKAQGVRVEDRRLPQGGGKGRRSLGEEEP